MECNVASSVVLHAPKSYITPFTRVTQIPLYPRNKNKTPLTLRFHVLNTWWQWCSNRHFRTFLEEEIVKTDFSKSTPIHGMIFWARETINWQKRWSHSLVPRFTELGFSIIQMDKLDWTHFKLECVRNYSRCTFKIVEGLCHAHHRFFWSSSSWITSLQSTFRAKLERENRHPQRRLEATPLSCASCAKTSYKPPLWMRAQSL